MEKLSEVLNGCKKKIRVSSAEIIVHGTKKKPYYEIKYRALSDGQIHIGYSSYNLDFVFGWLEECFEIVKEAADTIESLSAKLQAANMERSVEDCGGWIPRKERLPEDGVDVLVWFEYFRYGEYNRLFQTKGISYTFNGEWSGFVNGSSGWNQLRIIAWQPLPEDYHEP